MTLGPLSLIELVNYNDCASVYVVTLSCCLITIKATYSIWEDRSCLAPLSKQLLFCWHV